MKKIHIFILFIFLLSACATPTPVPTPTAAPTATPIPLSEIDLQSYLFEEGDLPNNLTPGQVRDFAPEMFSEVPKAENVVYMQFNKGSDSGGGVTVFLYESDSSRNLSYSLISDGLTSEAKETTNVGEKAKYITNSVLFEFVDLVFQRCKAVVHVRFSGTSDEDAAISYGRRLDERLSPVICQ